MLFGQFKNYTIKTLAKEKLTHSKGPFTEAKVEQFKTVITAALHQHSKLRPGRPFGVVELYGGPFFYEEDEYGPAFYGSPYHFYTIAKSLDVEVVMHGFETDLDRAIDIQTGLINVGVDPDSFDIVNQSNEMIGITEPAVIMPKYGIITADADGMFDMSVVQTAMKLYPNYSLLLNFNCVTPKRRLVQKKLKHNPKLRPLVEYLAQLPEWPKYLTKPKDIWQWVVAYINKEGIKSEDVPGMIPFNSDEGIQYLNKVSMYKKELIEGHTIFGPLFKDLNLAKALGLIIDRVQYEIQNHETA